MKISIGIIFLAISISAISQSDNVIYSKNYLDTIKLSLKKPTIVFLCPTDFVNTDTMYLFRVKELKRKYVKSAYVLTVIYTPNSTYSHVLSIQGDTLLQFRGYFGCFIVNYSCERVDSTVNRSSLKNKYWLNSITKNVTEIKLYDNWCPQNLGERLYYYNHFLKELISPIYTQDDKIEFLENRVKSLDELVLQMNSRLELLEKENSANVIKDDNKELDITIKNIDKSKKHWFANIYKKKKAQQP